MDERPIGSDLRGTTGESRETPPPGAGGAVAADARTGPTWRGWVISILAAVILSVAATVIFGGTSLWNAPAAVRAGGCGGPCCGPADR